MQLDHRYTMTARGGIPVLTWPAFDGMPVSAVVTTRDGGVSSGPYATLNLGMHVGDEEAAVRRNRERAAAAVDLQLDDLVFCTQTHGREVVTVTRDMAGMGARSMATAVPGADALVTSDPGVGLVVLMADCVPIVLVDPVTSTIACVHAGWRGTVARVLDATIEVMVARGVRAEDLVAGIGPAVPRSAYQVGPEVEAAVRDAFGGDVAGLIEPDGTGRWHLDLWAATVRTLTEAGVPRNQIALAAVPTGASSPFFSDRAARPCGRFALIARVHG